jgi:hypothetical protein
MMTRIRKLNQDDAPGTVVFMNVKTGVLLANVHNGYGWVLFDGSFIPETISIALLWVDY